MSTEAEAMRPPPLPAYAPPLPVTPPVAGLPQKSRRAAAAAACLVVGLGLVTGAIAGTWAAAGPQDRPAAQAAYARGGTLWQNVPVDTLFPPAVHAAAAGPGGADRDWTRIGVAPDGGCTGAFDPLLTKALAPVGCKRLLRATYADATSTNVTTVGLLITDTDSAGMRALRDRFTEERLDERPDLMPRPYAPKGTVADGFGDAQRGSWRISVLTDVPVVVYAVTGFADARTGIPPQPADQAVVPGASTAPAQAGLGHDAAALAEQTERTYRAAARQSPQEARR